MNNWRVNCKVCAKYSFHLSSLKYGQGNVRATRGPAKSCYYYIKLAAELPTILPYPYTYAYPYTHPHIPTYIQNKIQFIEPPFRLRECVSASYERLGRVLTVIRQSESQIVDYTYDDDNNNNGNTSSQGQFQLQTAIATVLIYMFTHIHMYACMWQSVGALHTVPASTDRQCPCGCDFAHEKQTKLEMRIRNRTKKANGSA